MSYAAREIRDQLARGTQPDESFFRVKVTGNGETKWFNVSAHALDGFARVLERESQAWSRDARPNGPTHP